MSGARKSLGKRGEQLATNYLQQLGYTIVTTNWRCSYGELDIIALKDEVLVFVEVRTRYAASTDAALESVKLRKQSRLQQLAYAYLAAHDMEDTEWRIDLIAVAIPYSGQPVIEHVENALEW